MTLEELRTELAEIIAGLHKQGFNSPDAGIIDRLGQLGSSALELDLKEGKHLIDNLVKVIIAIREGKSKTESGNLRLIALEFYLDKISSEEPEELLDVIL